VLLPLLSLALAGEPTVTTLPNGLQLVVERDDTIDEVVLIARYGVGASFERAGEFGLAHLFEHLMFEGSESAPGNTFDTSLTSAGGENNAWTYEDKTVYFQRVPTGALNLSLFLEADRLAHLGPALTDESVENQKLVVLRERADAYTPEAQQADAALRRVVYPSGHPYQHPVIGTIKDIQDTTRESALAFHARHYRTDNLVLYLRGPLEAELVAERVGHWFAEQAPASPRPAQDELPGSNDPSIQALSTDGDTGVHLAWETVPANHPDAPALTVLSWLLSGGRGTPVDDKFYYKGNLGSDSGAWSETWLSTGLFTVMAYSGRALPPRLEKLLRATVAKATKRAPNDDQLKRAKIQATMELRQEQHDRIENGINITDCVAQGLAPTCTQDRLNALHAVTAEDVVRVARTYLTPERAYSLWVGPPGVTGSAPAVEVP